MKQAGKIFLLKEGTGIEFMNEQEYETEDMLQELIEKYPDFLAGDQINPDDPLRWLLIDREMGVPAYIDGGAQWSIDHLFVDNNAIPTFVECKRAVDTRSRREVVAQMLDYAANGTKHWPIEHLKEKAATNAGKKEQNFAEKLKEFLQTEDEKEIEQFWFNLENNLQEGKIRLMFVCDTIHPELKRVVEFLNEQMEQTEVLALEIKLFASGQAKVMVPRLIGMTEMARQTKRRPSKRKEWDEEKILLDCEERNSKEVFKAFKEIHCFAKEEFGAENISFGAGNKYGSITYIIKDISILSLDSSGRIGLKLANMKDRIPDDIIIDYVESLNKINGISVSSDLTKWPGIRIEDGLVKKENLEKFKKTVKKLVQKIKEQ